VRTGRIFLDESSKRGAGFRNFSFLSQFGRGLIVWQGQVESRFGSDFAALLFADLDVFLENKVVPKPGGAAEDDNCEKQNEEATSWFNSAGGNFVADAANFQPRCAENLGRFLAAGEEPVPEPADGALFLVAPSVMTILAVKLFGNDFLSRTASRLKAGVRNFRVICGYSMFEEPHCGQRIIAPATSGSVVSHSIIKFCARSKSASSHHDFGVGLRAGHERDRLKMALIMNVGIDAGFVESAALDASPCPAR